MTCHHSFSFLWRNEPTPGLRRLFFDVSTSQFDTHTHTHTLGRTALNNEPARRRAHYLHNKHKRRTSIPTSGFEPAIPALERPQTHASKRTATAIGPRSYEGKRCRNEK